MRSLGSTLDKSGLSLVDSARLEEEARHPPTEDAVAYWKRRRDEARRQVHFSADPPLREGSLCPYAACSHPLTVRSCDECAGGEIIAGGRAPWDGHIKTCDRCDGEGEHLCCPECGADSRYEDWDAEVS